MKSAMDFPHYVYMLTDGYVGITSNLDSRMNDHRIKRRATLAKCFMVPTRREAEGVEATFHQLQKTENVIPFFCEEFFLWHSLWFHRGCKGYPKHLTQQPRLKF